MIQEAAIKGFAGETAKFAVSKTTPFFKGLKDEIVQFAGNGIERYTQRFIDRFAYSKTFLHRAEPAFFYDYYFPLDLKGPKRAELTDDIRELFKDHNYATIIGDAGSGKSTLIRHYFLTSLKISDQIPIYLELRYINNTQTELKAFIYKSITDNSISENEKIFNRMLEKGLFTFFLDGYDEVNPDVKSHVSSAINDFMTRYPKNYYVLTGRPQSDVESFPKCRNYRIKPLEQKKIKAFIEHQPIDYELKEKLIESVKGNQHRHVTAFLANPLLLSLYILSFRAHPSIPEKKSTFYRRVIDTLFTEHDSLSKLGYERELYTKLDQESFEVILKRFCIISYLEGQYDFKKDYVSKIIEKVKNSCTDIKFDSTRFSKDMTSSVSLWMLDDGTYSFAHRSIQEYFAALYVSTIAHEKRKAVYKTIQQKLRNSEPIQAFNFLGLCEELDEIEYNRMFLLPCLDDLLSKFYRKPKKEKALIFLQEMYSTTMYGYSISESKKKHINMMGRTGRPNPILHFSKAHEDSDNYVIFNKSLHKHVLKYNYKEIDKAEIEHMQQVNLRDVYTVSIENMNADHTFIDFLVTKLHFDKHVEKVITQLKSIKKASEVKIAQQIESTDNILEGL